MSREIKFRAWDVQNKRMYLPGKETGMVGNRNSSEIGITAQGKPLLLIYYGEPEYSDYEEFEDGEMVLMQYTGLKDKNGKEIYDGDIIDRGNNAVVMFADGRFQPVYSGGTEEPMEDEFYLFAHKCEVVGNVYENPDLLSNKQ